MMDLRTADLPSLEPRPEIDYAAWAVEHAKQRRQDDGRGIQCDTAQTRICICADIVQNLLS